MRKTYLPLLILLGLAFGFTSNAMEVDPYVMPHDTTGKHKHKKEKDNDSLKVGPFLDNEPRGEEDYSLEDRKEVHKLWMPRYDQDTVSFHNGKKRRKKQEAFLNRDYYYPAKPKDKWIIGVQGGMSALLSDVAPTFMGEHRKKLPGWNVGGYLQKSMGYMASLRIRYRFHKMNGQSNYFTNGGVARDINPVLRDYWSDGQNVIVDNYKVTAHELDVDFLIHFGGQRFHKERTKTNFYAILSPGVAIWNNMVNLYDENGDIYDYNTFLTDALAVPGGKERSSYIVSELNNNILDDTWETRAHYGGLGFKLGDKEWELVPKFEVGFGFAFRITRWMFFNFEGTANITFSDYLDGQAWQDDGSLTPNNDVWFTGDLGLAFQMGKKRIEPYVWLNPMDYTYKKLGDMDPEKMIDDLLKDDDEDGVPNRMDQEPETPKGCPVDVKGVALDSDGDGCIDCLDQEPFSPPGYPIDENCVAIVPQIDPECCDKMGANCDPTDLPSIHFASDKYYIQPEYYASLHIIGEKMLMCPDLKVVATGYTDVFSDPKYNEKLSWNRVNQSVEYLVDKYGISRDRFIVDYKGETEADPDSPNLENRKVGFRVAEDGEAGDSNPADPHPGLKAGSER